MIDSSERGLPERTGRHYCTRCLAETPADDYLEYDHLCRACAAEADEFPLASTPEKKAHDRE